MAAELQALDHVAVSARDAVRQYAGLLAELAGEDLAGLTLYGPVLGASYDGSRQPVRSVAVLQAIRLELLRELAGHGPRMAGLKIAAPIVMTPGYIQESRDTFPLELLEIQQQSVTVLGTDYFRHIQLESGHLRLQCERELKVLLIGMRQGLLASAGDAAQLGQMEDRAAESLTRVLRGLLWIQGETDPLDPPSLVVRAERVLQRELPTIRTVVGSDTGRGWEQFVGLYQDLEALRELVDAA
jgi:hypothetical protein